MQGLMRSSLVAVALLAVAWFSRCGLFRPLVVLVCLYFGVVILFRKPVRKVVFYILGLFMLMGGLFLLWEMSLGLN